MKERRKPTKCSYN